MFNYIVGPGKVSLIILLGLAKFRIRVHELLYITKTVKFGQPFEILIGCSGCVQVMIQY